MHRQFPGKGTNNLQQNSRFTLNGQRNSTSNTVAGQWGIASQITSNVNTLRTTSSSVVSCATSAIAVTTVTTTVNTLSSSMPPYAISSTMNAANSKFHDKAPQVTPLKVKEEPQPVEQPDIGLLRDKLLEFYLDSIDELKGDYKEKLQELFFIQSGGNMVDYPSWKIRPNPHLLSFLNVYRLDDTLSFSTPTATNTISPSVRMQASYSSSTSTNQSQMIMTSSTSYQNKKTEQYGFMNSDNYSNRKWSSIKADYSKSPTISDKYKNTFNGNINRSSSTSHEEIADQVRHESEILHKISVLRKNGLWSASRLPKVHEQQRKKSHWDYVLEEMQWLAADFSQENRWKRNMARKLSRSVVKFHQDKETYQRRVKKDEKIRLRRIASGIAKEVKQFWIQIEKIACYKQQSRQEEQRKKALDLHLNFIVDQTEKYSSWLVEGMKDSSVSSPVSSRAVTDDEEYEPGPAESDDEQTIAEEEEVKSDDSDEDELDVLKREGEMPIEDLINTLPDDMIENITQGNKQQSDTESSSDEEDDNKDERDAKLKNLEEDGGEFVLKETDMASDDEQTLDQEEAYDDADHDAEIDVLQKEGEMPIEELLKLYGAPGSSSQTHPSNDEDSDISVSDDDDDDNAENEDDVPLNVLETSFNKSKDTDENQENKESSNTLETTNSNEDESVPNKELNDAAATAESLQPKGFTLSTTQVKTKIPFLLRHTLREYQHIGLDWLVTMFAKQLNGILADEMGLGKTIQTISLLAHLACEEGCWGPHLIVVPTSVMLNWEFEFKKWCPGFKILTYFGSQKERKLKRVGWSKPNAFHVCITSYKLVIQDHQAFRRRKWKYLILDEAQNIKNFKSQRWQMLLNFNSQRRLLLTGTPLQNSLMELWSLMHFLMPNIFQSHHDFKEWFSNPLTGMIEGSREYNEGIVRRLHTVLRPFLLRRLKSEVELQMPKKYEHVIKCRLSKRQRFLYDEFMSRTKTKETLAAGNFLSVINILMQLRKVCNHPDLFELRPTVAPYVMEKVVYEVPGLCCHISNKRNFSSLNLCLPDLESTMSSFQSYRTQQLKVKKNLITELDTVQNDSDTLIHSSSHSNVINIVNLNKDTYKQSVANEIETNRSYLDVVTPSASTAGGYALIGDILTRQVEDSLDGCDIDVVNVDDEVSFVPCVEIDENHEAETSSCETLLESLCQDTDSEFYMQSLQTLVNDRKRERLEYMANMNEQHCKATPLYGIDLRQTVTIEPKKWRIPPTCPQQYVSCSECNALQDLVKTPIQRLRKQKEILKRFSLYVYPVISPTIELKSSRVHPSEDQRARNFTESLNSHLAEKSNFLYPLLMNQLLQFPETRLVQYDCGKLQALDALLRQLKAGKHRVLIFTQMTRMLDVLERFLNYHGYIYLRLDGNTKVEQRQMLMERFNQDKKIFVFILSTRSGGIGVNLTGADTVVFYDSDWNPTMDAQAQDRCHRIGQTRDVHIYRLISDRTVEENILKKAHQKRLLGDLAIEGGNFTAAYFKKDSVKELFDLDVENEPMEVVETKKKETKPATKPAEPTEKAESSTNDPSSKQYEQVLADAEEEDDVKAAKQAKAEIDSEMMEFNDNSHSDNANNKEVSKVEESLMMLEAELRPIERLALRFMESTNTYQVEDEVEETERQLELRKKEWELDHLQSLKEEEERRNAEIEDDMLFTYIRDDTYDKPYIDEYTGVHIQPIWTPPTPPQDGDVEYSVDHCLGFLYETGTIPENLLPPIHYLRKNGMDLYAMKKNTSRTHYLSLFRKKRSRVSKPKSIFDKKTLELISKNKLKKSQKFKQKVMQTNQSQSTSTATSSKPDYSQQGPEWLVSEDWALLQAVASLVELPLDLQTETIYNKMVNWELAADLVNLTSRSNRSARQCRDRYQNVVVSREEGKLMQPISDEAKKKKKNLNPGVPQVPSKTMATTQPEQKTQVKFNQDQGKSVASMHAQKFDSVKKAASKRKPVTKQPNPSKGQNTRNATSSSNQTSSEKPLNPRELAQMRSERIAKEKAHAVVAAQQLQQTTTSTAQSQVSATNRITVPTNTVVAGQISKMPSVGIITTAANNIRGLSTTAGSFAAINRKMQNVPQNVVSANQITTVSVNATTRSLAQVSAHAVAQIGLTSRATAQGGSTVTVAVTSSQAASVLAPNLIAQVQRAKSLTPHQIAILRQKAQQQQQQQYQKLQQQRIQHQKQQQIKLLQQQQLQQQQQQQPQSQSQTAKQVQSAIVASSHQIGSVTVQPIKNPVTVRSSTQQIMTKPLTQAQHQQLLEQALKNKHIQQQLQQRGGLTSASQIQQMLATQKLTPQHIQQLQQHQQRQKLQQQQQQQQQQLKLQQQAAAVGATIVSQPKAQLVMTQVKPGQSLTSQSMKTSGQPIQLQHLTQTGQGQSSIPQQILLRPTSQAVAQAHIQGIPQQIQLRAMISQQSPQQIQCVSTGQQLQAMQAQLNLQTGTVVMHPQQVTTSDGNQQTQANTTNTQQQTQVQQIRASSNQKSMQLQQNIKVTNVNSSSPNKTAQIQLQLQQTGGLSQQLRQQVISATPAQLSQVKAYVSQAQLQASLNASSSLNSAQVTSQNNQVTVSSQALSQQANQQMRQQALLQVKINPQITTSSDGTTTTVQFIQQQQIQKQLQQQLQMKANQVLQQQHQQQQQQQQQQQKQKLQQKQHVLGQVAAENVPAAPVNTQSQTPQKSEAQQHSEEVEIQTLGAVTELTAVEAEKTVETPKSAIGMRTRSSSNK